MRAFYLLLALATSARLCANPQVFIDPGHGGSDLGVHDANLNEASVVFEIAQDLQGKLREDGIESVLSRDATSAPTLATRCAEANASGAKAFISLHLNFSPSPLARGPRVFIAKASASAVAGGVLPWNDAAAAKLDASKALAESLARTLGGAEDAKVSVQNLKLAAFKGLAIPGTLVELGFLSDADSEKRFQDSSYRHRLASALASGLRNWLASQDSSSSSATP